MSKFPIVLFFIVLVSAACVDYTTTAKVNVRSGPGTTYSVLKSVASGSKVCVESTTNGWAKLDKGYVSASYVKKASTSSTSSSSTPATTTTTTTTTTSTSSSSGKKKVSDITYSFDEPKVSSLKKLTLWATGYFSPIVEANGSYALRKKDGSVIASVSNKDWCKCAMEGSCTVSKGGNIFSVSSDGSTSSNTVSCSAYYKLSGYSNCKVKFRMSKGVLGDGAYKPVVPYRSLAVDRSTIKLGTVIYIPSARGTQVSLPDGRTVTHDGYFLAADVGGAIKGNHVDVFLGNTDPEKSNPFKWIKSSKTGTFPAYVVTDQKIIKDMIDFASNFTS